MKTVTVNASRTYPILIDNGLISRIGQYTLQVKGNCKIVIISDSNVWPLYGDEALSSFECACYSCVYYIIPAGETSKNSHQYISILNFLAEKGITRDDLLIALGGGVVGDLCGFVAATYLRGVQYIQVPTTLLAMIDSSVGGKTAINLPAGKNLVGAFYQPSMVLCDLSALDTLPIDTLIDGCAEMIKYGILYDTALFTHLSNNGLDFDREYTISRCIELKRNVVMQDEFDTGTRQMLNLGHTAGHSIEKCSNYSISHGRAVAIGMAIITRASLAKGYCPPSVCRNILDTLMQFSLPVTADFTVAELSKSAFTDKKTFGTTINLIIPRDIGDCIILPVPTEELSSFFEAGL